MTVLHELVLRQIYAREAAAFVWFIGSIRAACHAHAVEARRGHRRAQAARRRAAVLARGGAVLPSRPAFPGTLKAVPVDERCQLRRVAAGEHGGQRRGGLAVQRQGEERVVPGQLRVPEETQPATTTPTNRGAIPGYALRDSERDSYPGRF